MNDLSRRDLFLGGAATLLPLGIPQEKKKLKTEKLEIKKYNPALRRHTVHREIK